MSKRPKKATLDSIAKSIDDLARITANGFANTATKQDLAMVEQSLKSDITKIDECLRVVESKLDRALYTELVHLESRLRKVEEKIGIKPAQAATA